MSNKAAQIQKYQQDMIRKDSKIDDLIEQIKEHIKCNPYADYILFFNLDSHQPDLLSEEGFSVEYIDDSLFKNYESEIEEQESTFNMKVYSIYKVRWK